MSPNRDDDAWSDLGYDNEPRPQPFEEPKPAPPPDFEKAKRGVRQARAVLEALANIDKHKPPEQEPNK